MTTITSRRTRQEQEIYDWDGYDEDGEIPEMFFDLAAEVAEDYQ